MQAILFVQFSVLKSNKIRDEPFELVDHLNPLAKTTECTVVIDLLADLNSCHLKVNLPDPRVIALIENIKPKQFV